METDNDLPKIRAELLHSFQDRLVPLELFDKFQVAGIFVNWWQTINYDLKTIAAYGWSVNLIPDEYIKKAFFQKEMYELDSLETQISDEENKVQEAMEEAEVEPETDDEGNEKPLTSKWVIEQLLAAAHDLLGNFVDNPAKLKPTDNANLPKQVPADAQKEILGYLLLAHRIGKAEARTKDLKKTLKEKEARLEDLVDAKKYGRDGFIAHLNDLIILREAEKAAAEKNAEKAKIQKRIDEYNQKKSKVEELVAAIGQPITNGEARDLILQKHHDLMQEQLDRYLNREKRELVALVEKLWDKYAVSRNDLEKDRDDVLKKMNDFLSRLKYQ